jgi:hypothetical protein
MMARRCIFAFVCAGLVGMLAVCIWLLCPPPSAITKENGDRIQLGMTLQEVEAILAGPPRDETCGRVIVIYDGSRNESPVRCQWIGADLAVCVEFENGQVSWIERGIVFLRDETMLQVIRRYLRL